MMSFFRVQSLFESEPDSNIVDESEHMVLKENRSDNLLIKVLLAQVIEV